ncbi:hypothetical protein DPMN_107215 [Dreissena polymorpha]|uniref:Uncharacterized protein n=1 Tax=Dreissena polymorpha TaxID=45954 RepID=A0A9D4K6N2_DREPO|nr:hypothetical protein DPMN_107215 [Dreissena polymorpha]
MLRQDTEIGRAERIERIVSVLAKEECTEDKWNHAAIRRVKTSQESARSDHIKSMPMSASKEIPEHLINLFERSTLGRGH